MCSSFNISVAINSKKPIEQVLSEAIKESYDKIKDNLEPPLQGFYCL